ncbi:MAG: hypothetical protein VZS44_07870 [Bacilli bacterium]|nr:hypothetical protein [Bacilli bacterium]
MTSDNKDSSPVSLLVYSDKDTSSLTLSCSSSFKLEFLLFIS